MIKLLIAFVMISASAPAFADLEVRGQFGVMPAQSGSLNGDLNSTFTTNPSINSITTIGGDVIFKIPIIPLAFGLRYESLTGSASGQATLSSNAVTANSKITGSRVLALASYRPLSLPFGYIGIIAHYALSEDLKYSESAVQNSNGTTTNYSFTGTIPASYGGGIEAGLTLGRFVLGVEGGYTSFMLQDMTESNNAITFASKPTLDLSGVYFRASIGLSFF